MGIEQVKEQKAEKPREKWRNRLRLQIAGSQKMIPDLSSALKKHIPKLPISKHAGFGATGTRPYTYILLVHLTKKKGGVECSWVGRMNP